MAIVADKYTLAPACCMQCGWSKTPCLDLQSENDDLAYRVTHNYLCRDCIRDYGITITRWGIEHQQPLGWSIITDEEREHLIDERNAAIQEAEAANAELRNYEAISTALGNLRLTPTPEPEVLMPDPVKVKQKQRVGSGPINP
jgi:hypothetical protein